jgi:hypothetical protein
MVRILRSARSRAEEGTMKRIAEHHTWPVPLLGLLALGACAGPSPGADGLASATDLASRERGADARPAADARADVVRKADTTSPQTADGPGKSCTFQGKPLAAGESVCPCKGCDEVVTCLDGMLSMAECMPGTWCAVGGEGTATCVCNMLQDQFCPEKYGVCPQDPDCT